jgi:hypothetical protein
MLFLEINENLGRYLYMMIKFEFYLSEKNFDRIELIKEKITGKQDLTMNEFAREILEEAICKLYYETKGGN